jgi:HNH endonuclease
VRGPLPPGTRLVHRCGDARCVNPDHMEVVDL